MTTALVVETSVIVNNSRIDLFTDTADILNLLHLRSIMGCPGALAQYIRALFGQKENFSVYFSEKGDHYYIKTLHNDIFFPITIFF